MHDHKKLPVYLKGEEIFHLISCIGELVPEDNAMLQHIRVFMLEDAAILTVKVSGAAGADLYDIQMENAVLIRKAARDLLINCTALEMYGFQDTICLPLLRQSIEEYRLLFLEWIAGFDPWNYLWDDWGLFNPPGTSRQEDEDYL